MRQAGPLIGVLGGMGPLATADFMAQLVRLTDAAEDQDHHRCMVYMNPHLPDRSAAILGHGACPLAGLLGGVSMLERCGVDVIAMPCNTAHHWLSDLRAATGTPILSIVDAVALDLRRHGIDAGRVGLLGTLGTVRSGIYERGFAGSGFDLVGPTGSEIAHFVEPAIRAVKAGRIDQAKPLLGFAIEALEARGVAAVVLGCTELPLAVSELVSAVGTPFVDSTKALAAACVAWAERFQSDAATARPRMTHAA